ncbi:MAG: zinc-binding dehydrogenase, partial [Candidatus Bathyarchaeia archaeon]
KIFIPQANIIGIDIREDALEFANNIAKKNNVIFINASKEEPVETIKNVTHGEGVKAIIDFVGSTQTVATYIKTISPLGTYVLVGLLGARGLKLPSPFILMDTECIIQGNSMGSLPDLYEIVEFARKKRLDYRTIVTKRYNFDAEQVNKAFKEFDENKITGRQIITFN